MTSPAGHVHFDLAALTASERYKLLIGTVIPRPIAFVTTVDEQGRINATKSNAGTNSTQEQSHDR